MPWPVRSRLLVRWVGNINAGVVQVLGVVPAGKTWLVKEFAQYNSAASTATATFGTRIGASAANCEVLSATPASGFNARLGRALVIPAGYELYVVMSVGGIQQLHISGAELG